MARDLLGREGYQAYANAALSWATFTTFGALFTYWLHQRKSKSLKRFVLLYTFFLVCAVFAQKQWHALYK